MLFARLKTPNNITGSKYEKQAQQRRVALNERKLALSICFCIIIIIKHFENSHFMF
jgi:hypothetical protein